MKTTNKLFLLVIFMMAIGAVSCAKGDDTETKATDESEETTTITLKYPFSFFPREVNYSLIEHSMAFLSYTDDDNEMWILYPSSLMEEIDASEVDASEYVMYLTTCNVFATNDDGVESCNYWDFQYVGDDEKSMIDEHNYELEEMFDDLFSYFEVDGMYTMDLATVKFDYRISALTGLNITCDTELFGVEAGGSLNDYFNLYLVNMVGTIARYIVSTDNEMITSSIYGKCGMSIEEYLAVNPYAPTNISFGFNELPTNLPQTVTFTVDMEIDGTKTVSSTSDPITLI